MPKVTYATTEDHESAKAELTNLINGTKTSLEKGLKSANDELKKKVAELTGHIDKQSAAVQESRTLCVTDAKAYTDARDAALRDELMGQINQVTDAYKASEASMTEKLNQMNTELRAAVAQEMVDLCAQLEQKLNELREDQLAKQDERGREIAEEMVGMKRSLESSLDEVRQASEARDQEIRQALEAESKRIMEAMAKGDDQLLQRSIGTEGDLHIKIDNLQERLDAEIADHKEHAANMHDELRNGAENNLGAFREDADKRLTDLDTRAQELRDAVSEVENLSTRRVDWVIKNVSQRLRPRTPSRQAKLHTSWFSPKFDAAGAHGLQLELQVYRPSDPPVEGEAEGDCAVYLWACKGMSLVYKLYIGNKSATMEKVFNGRVPFGTKRMCFLRNQINREEDTLRISVEILEAVREIQHIIDVPPAPASLEDCENQEEKDPASQPLEGSILLRRHVNNRLHEQVKTQVQVMQSRMIRRIEWRLEQASQMRRCFGPGEPMCSPSFSAAGIESMQLMFYPSGYNGATDGYCSVYLYAPAGVTLKCTLWAGQQRRDASHFFEASGAFGRTNFCRFESCVDEEDDTVLLALDIDEAHQDVKATIAHPTQTPGDRRSQAQLDGATATAVQSVVKLQKVPGKPTNGLEEMRVLPSLWAAKPFGEKGAGLDSLRSFDELKGTGGATRGRMAISPDSSPLQAGMSRRSESTPLLRRSMREGEEDMLPQLGSTRGGDFMSSSLRPKKVRSKSGASTMQLLQAGSS